MNRRIFLKRSAIAAPFALGTAAGYARFVERHSVEVVRQDIDIGIGEPLTAAVLGDIHFDPLCETDYLKGVVDRVNGLTPDVILYTGDFLSDSAKRLPDLAGILRGATAAFGCFAALGNHDHWIEADEVTTGLRSAGITVLRNETVPLPGRTDWYLTGLESHWRGRPSTKSLEATPGTARHIVIAHEPDSFDLLTDSRIALQLSGHTHGGQVRLPFVGAIQLPTWGKKYQAGLYETAGRHLYVNRGIGTVVRHYRLNCRPEITLLKLT